MILRIDHPADSMDWQRIAALGSSFAAHLAAVALIASPLQVPLRRERPPIIEATLTVNEAEATALGYNTQGDKS